MFIMVMVYTFLNTLFVTTYFMSLNAFLNALFAATSFISLNTFLNALVVTTSFISLNAFLNALFAATLFAAQIITNSRGHHSQQQSAPRIYNRQRNDQRWARRIHERMRAPAPRQVGARQKVPALPSGSIARWKARQHK